MRYSRSDEDQECSSLRIVVVIASVEDVVAFSSVKSNYCDMVIVIVWMLQALSGILEVCGTTQRRFSCRALVCKPIVHVARTYCCVVGLAVDSVNVICEMV